MEEFEYDVEPDAEQFAEFADFIGDDMAELGDLTVDGQLNFEVEDW